MAYQDLRGWMEEAEKIGELTRLSGVDWDIEVGAISSMTTNAVLFDDFPGYPKGYRILSNLLWGTKRWKLALNWSTDAEKNDLCREFKDRLHAFKPIPPNWVQSGPILENIQEGKDIDVLKICRYSSRTLVNMDIGTNIPDCHKISNWFIRIFN